MLMGRIRMVKQLCAIGCAMGVLLWSGCAWISPTLQGSGISVVEVRECSGFDSVDVSSILRTKITEGSEFSVQVQGDDNLVPLVETRVVGSTWRISFTANARVSTQEPLLATITLPSLKKLDLSGASRADVDGSLEVLDVSGASSANVQKIVGPAIKVSASGASSVTLVGSVGKLDVDCSGACKVNANDLVAESITIDASGASAVDFGKTSTVTGEISGASTVSVLNGADVNVSTSGASKLKKK